MNDAETLYVCLKLNPESRGRLRELTVEMFNDEYCRLLCDHLTLAYGPEVRDFDESLIGRKATISASKVAFDENIAALEVDRDQVKRLGVHNRHPHITLAIFDHSTQPAYSNHMLNSEHEVIEFAPEDEIRLTGEIVAVMKRK